MENASLKRNQLYVPDFKAWERFYERKVPSHTASSQREQPFHSKRPAEVKLQFVSPVEETVDQAESEIRSNATETKSHVKKQKGNKDSGALPRQPNIQDIIRASSLQKKTTKQGSHKNKGASKDKKKFSYRTLNDIFSAPR
jgi:hypothetical protein